MNIFTAKRYEEKIKSIITVSKIYSIDEISGIANLNETDTIILIEKMIKKSKNNWDYRFFRNAHINYQTNEIVLDETKSNTIVDKLGKMTGSLMDKFTPKEPVKEEDWKCPYCGGLNKPEAYKCNNCSASKE